MGLEISGSRQEMKFLANGKESLAKAAMGKGRASEIAIGGGRIWGRIEFKMTTLRRFELRKFTFESLLPDLGGEVGRTARRHALP